MKKGITFGKIRSNLYRLRRLSGDINAIRRGTIVQRVTNRILGRLSRNLIRKLSKLIIGALK